MRGPNATSSRTVAEKTCASLCWKTNPTRLRNPRLHCSSSSASSVIAVPKAVKVPLAGNTSPSSTFSSVDFPQPLAPSTATRSPGWTSSETPSSAGNRSR